MTHVVCEPCHDCKYTDCCVVCPVPCFYEDDHMLYIDPDMRGGGCIDCGLCVDECPVEAIDPEANVPAKWTDYVPLNRDRATALKADSAPINEKRTPLAGTVCASHAG